MSRESWKKSKVEVEGLRKADYTNSIGMQFMKIPAGDFMMGSNKYASEQPIHRVSISKQFYFGKYPVTQKEWKAVMGSNPSRFKGDNNPVENVSWNDVQEFVKKLNAKEGVTAYRLPFEAEWEYACRAGTTTRYFFGKNSSTHTRLCGLPYWKEIMKYLHLDDISKLKKYAWYSGHENHIEWAKDMDIINEKGTTHPVGQKKPNPWSLYDLYGNVWEWMQDNWYGNYECELVYVINPYKPARGSSWINDASFCRSASRNGYSSSERYDNVGFRLLKTI
ncbi:formylglycine-generating enzyme family protein [uncultured Methanolobus sp.]|uniref:formylglycine-generating enzyme family protein n=1 Tax=uncultured Methanolobus sp. TaxID=218300 RepID=UPI002AAA6CDC|nr:formylglycine-generating enzyme family protein [uncultured Methanolobus sp.]